MPCGLQVDYGRALLALDVALYEAVGKLAASAAGGGGRELAGQLAGSRAAGGVDLGCWQALVRAGSGGGQAAGAAWSARQWNLAAAAWLGQQQRSALSARCGFVGQGSEAAGYHSPWRLNPQQLAAE